MRSSTSLCVVLLAAAAAPALAGPIDISAMPTPQLPQGGYAPRTGGIHGVAINDRASMTLDMMDGANHTAPITTAEDASVQRGPTFTDLGVSANGGGHILGSWDEFVIGQSTYVNAIFKSATGAQLMPGGAQINGSPAYFWSWHFGATDPVNFQPFVTQVHLLSARAYFSDNSGQSFNSFNDIAPNINPNWLPGRDPGQLLASVGDGTNYVFLQYEIQIVPAPAALSALAGLPLLTLRRRR